MNARIECLRERLADALRAAAERLDPEDYPIGSPALDAEGQPMPRCTSCGVPRGTLRHALICKGGGCTDPDAKQRRITDDLKCPGCRHRIAEHDAIIGCIWACNCSLTPAQIESLRGVPK